MKIEYCFNCGEELAEWSVDDVEVEEKQMFEFFTGRCGKCGKEWRWTEIYNFVDNADVEDVTED